MSKYCIIFVSFFIVLSQTVNNVNCANIDNTNSKKSILSSIFVDDIVVESTLNIRQKPGARQGRARQLPDGTKTGEPSTAARVDGSQILNLKRTKRQNFGHRYPQQGYQPNFGHNFPAFQPPKFSASNAQAQAQAFQNNGPLGGFGAAAAGAGSQGFSFDETGFRGNAGMSGSQSYNLPNGQTIALSYTGGFSIGPDGKPVISKGNSLALSGPTKPIATYNPIDDYE